MLKRIIFKFGLIKLRVIIKGKSEIYVNVLFEYINKIFQTIAFESRAYLEYNNIQVNY
jgi:hypothetical protein